MGFVIRVCVKWGVQWVCKRICQEVRRGCFHSSPILSRAISDSIPTPFVSEEFLRV